MWLSEKAGAAGSRREADIETGRVSIGGRNPAVRVDAELRNLGILSAGGIIWLPSQGQQAAVLHCGDGGELLAGVIESPPEGMLPGEVLIKSGSGSIYLRADGQIDITGVVNITGALTVNGAAVTGL